MQTVVQLATGPGFGIDAVTCTDDHSRWSAPEVEHDHELVLVRRGMFRRRSAGREAVIDTTMAYLSASATEEQYAHPAGGDICTVITVRPELWQSLTGDPKRFDRSTIYVDARLDLVHRRVLAGARGGDTEFGVAEELLRLIRHAVGQVARVPGGGGSGRQKLVDRARAAIIDRHPDASGLLPLARLLAVSPYRLSRAFSTELGVTLTCYRNRVRVAWALDRLEQGTSSLADLAADLGFADQAHLSRTVRQHTGRTPATVRRLLAASGRGEDST
ncbi:helix-turn-helix domain-containing protein [Microlunatus speluncae]|uniref:helix-turn-helix domain-containing protein n=1 Tax=Microlunatus speluncae TaxID=2594267 RepID=UPI0012667DC8|nr:AraC family transcriptional regulator [Microlunatus speluncae]